MTHQISPAKNAKQRSSSGTVLGRIILRRPDRWLCKGEISGDGPEWAVRVDFSVVRRSDISFVPGVNLVTKHRLVGKYTTLYGIYPGKDGDFQWRSVRLPEL